MPTTDNKPKPRRRRNAPLFLTMPPDELARLRAFAAQVGRPVSWTVRDALRAYLDTVEADAAHLARLRADVQTPKKLDVGLTGKTQPPRRGRPPKAEA